jgi:hypothetical protein
VCACVCNLAAGFPVTRRYWAGWGGDCLVDREIAAPAAGVVGPILIPMLQTPIFVSFCRAKLHLTESPFCNTFQGNFCVVCLPILHVKEYWCGIMNWLADLPPPEASTEHSSI